MPHFLFLYPLKMTFDLGLRTRTIFLYNAPNRQDSSSYVESFASYRANKQAPLETSPLSTMLRRWVNMGRYSTKHYYSRLMHVKYVQMTCTAFKRYTK